jgi:hypothetical protein
LPLDAAEALNGDVTGGSILSRHSSLKISTLLILDVKYKIKNFEHYKPEAEFIRTH